MRSRTLSVLMWKHGTVRMRRFIHTAVDLVAPLLWFALLFAIKHNDLSPPDMSLHRNIEQPDPVELMEEYGALRILYYPDSPAAGRLMSAVAKKLNLEKATAYNFKDKFNKYYGISNPSLVRNFIDMHNPQEGLVIFQDMDGDTLPDQLFYTIRFDGYEIAETKSYQPSTYELEESHNSYGFAYKNFMSVQWAVDKSFIEAHNPDFKSPQVTLQGFPNYRQEINTDIKAASLMYAYACWLSLVLTFVLLMSRLLEERTTGIQEMIKMAGVSVHTLGFSHYLNVAPIGLVFAAVVTRLLKVTEHPLVPNANGLLIFLLLQCYFVTVVALAFVCSHLVRTSQYTITLSVFVYAGLCVPAPVIFSTANLPEPLLMLTGFLPHMPVFWFWNELGTLEEYRSSGLNWSTMWSSHSSKSCSVALCFAFLAAQAAALFFLSWYLTLVRPGKYGQPRPWNFLFQRQYWIKNKVNVQLDEEEEHLFPEDDGSLFEPPPAGAKVGIRVANVTKVYGKEVVLKNVSLDVYKGEITVLLGHNGAGKTTLMSIITGMTGATGGKVFVNGRDTETQLCDVRRHLGLCPQHNLFFPDLTVLEHVIFFTMLKQGSYAEAKQSSTELMKQLGLSGKEGELCRVLTGGMRRRAQLACTLAGGAELLVLDEPTSGLDVETRRKLWDLLLSLRGSRTVLLTTHFMEEADALGDRVAALHDGRLRCHATTMHLKKAIGMHAHNIHFMEEADELGEFGTGYRLSFMTKGVPKEPLITAAVSSHIPEAKHGDKTINSISYNLPAATSNKFPSLFTTLESQRAELGIDSIGVGVSTLEEVFLKLCSNVVSTVREEEVDTSVVDPTYNKLGGLPLYVQQLRVLLQRQLQYIIHRKWSFLILQVILPILIICLVTKLCNNAGANGGGDGPLLMDLNMYADVIDKRVLYTIQDSPALRTLTEQYPDVHFQKVNNITEVIKTAMADIFEYNKYIAGIELDDTDAKVLFTTTVRHAAPVAMNVLSNLLAARHLPPAAGRAITTINHPLVYDTARVTYPTITIKPKIEVNCFIWAACITFTMLASYINLVSLPCKEREMGARYTHIMCGCPVELHWAATLLAHTAVAVFWLLPMVVTALALDQDNTIDNAEFLGVMVLILLAGSLAFFAWIYLVSLYFREGMAIVVLIASIVIFGLVTAYMELGFRFTRFKHKTPLYYFVDVCGWVSAPHSAMMAAVTAACMAPQQNAILACRNCDYGTKPGALGAVDHLLRCYLCTDEGSPLFDIIKLFVQFAVYMALVILSERGVFSYIYDRLVNWRYQPVEQLNAVEMVRVEKDYVAPTIQLYNSNVHDSMLVDDVHKRYVSVLGKTCNAVQGVSFSVKKGECFGLLGVNGAGKSTTFKMLTAEQCPTRGGVYANGQHLGLSSAKYLRTLGYCPQTSSLDMFLTGSQNLTLLLTLRGHQREDVRMEVKSWINIVGLEKYAQRAVSEYSGGCVRRLGAAAALCVGGELTLLDEPTAGVDVAARRRVWAALRRGLRNKRSVVITSHSMDEMEALCSRIAIMSRGQVRALGSAAALRAAHGAGHAVVFKIRHARSADDEDAAISQKVRLKHRLHQLFNCTLTDTHKTMLHYHINDTMKFSELFEKLESLKREFPALIEDYSVTETTLEEVFLSIARAPTPP